MMKSYLRYEPKKTFGVISAPQCNVIYDFSGNLALTGGVQDVCVWNLRQASQIATLCVDEPNYPYSMGGEISVLARSPDKSTLAAGYTSGEVRIFNYISKELVATLKGHRSAVTSLVFEDGGEGGSGAGLLLASGGADCDIFLWDMVTNTGLCKLRGHKDAVTGIGFLQRGGSGSGSHGQRLLVSSSRDTLLKVWDIDTHYCIQTIVGHRSEIWSLLVLEDRGIVITGTSDDMMRGYRVLGRNRGRKGGGGGGGEEEEEEEGTSLLLDDQETVLEYYGSIKRGGGGAAAMSGGGSSSNDRCVGLSINASGTIIAAQSSSKNIDFFHLRSEEEAVKKKKRRLKRMREKALKGKSSSSSSSSGWNEEGEAGGEEDDEEGGDGEEGTSLGSDGLMFTDEIASHTSLKCGAKVRGMDFSPLAYKDGSSRLLVSLINNSLEVYKLVSTNTKGAADESSASTPVEAPSLTNVLELHGHRSDVRAVCVSGDGLLLATCSSEGVKTWSSMTHQCVRSCAAGYGVCIAFAPGARFVVCGTRDGHVQIIDTASGELTMDEQAHTGAVWSVCVRPDGKGFMTGGADKLVKFWDFSISNNKAAAATGLQASVSKQLQMTHDVLCLRYSPTKSATSLLLAAGLLDCTIKVFYDDSLRFFLSLYGHKLPVMCLDISDDSRLLVSGAADKTIKIWGLDFGDCHRSLIGHTDSVTCLRFQPDTHYFFSGSKDGSIKYWDADRFEQVLSLPGHKGSVWGIDVAPDASFCLSVGQDRSLRVWERGEDLVFVEEERERVLEAQADRAAGMDADGGAAGEMIPGGAIEDGVALASRKSTESVKGGELLMEALDLVEAELAELEERALSGATSSNKRAAPSNPRFLGLSPHAYMIRCLRSIKAPDLEQALLVLPFHYVSRLVSMLLELAKKGLDLELCCRSAVFLLRVHFAQLVSARALVEQVAELQLVLRNAVGEYRTLIGTNLAGLKFMSREIEERKVAGMSFEQVDEHLASQTGGGDKKKKNKRASGGGEGGGGGKKKKKA